MHAIILAGGKGRRLYPYTMILPKPLVPIGEMPIIEIVVRQLATQGFEHITIAVGYHAELIMAVMGDGSKWGVKIDYAVEDKPLRTIGPLSQISGLDKTFLVMNGDLLTDLCFSKMIDFHIRSDAIATIATCKRQVQLPLGVLTLDQSTDGTTICGFTEKPQFDYAVSMGIYLFEPDILKYIPPGDPFGFDDLMLRLLQEKVRINAFEFNGHWLDMGTHDDLDQAIEEFEQHRDRYLPIDRPRNNRNKKSAALPPGESTDYPNL